MQDCDRPFLAATLPLEGEEPITPVSSTGRDSDALHFVVLPVDATRAAGRRHWPVHIVRLADAGHDDVSAYTTAAERVLMVAQLTAEAWTLAGAPAPAYERSQTPVALRRLRSSGATQG